MIHLIVIQTKSTKQVHSGAKLRSALMKCVCACVTRTSAVIGLCVWAGAEVHWKVAQLWKTGTGDPEEPQCSRGAARVALQKGEKREGQSDNGDRVMVMIMAMTRMNLRMI